MKGVKSTLGEKINRWTIHHHLSDDENKKNYQSIEEVASPVKLNAVSITEISKDKRVRRVTRGQRPPVTSERERPWLRMIFEVEIK